MFGQKHISAALLIAMLASLTACGGEAGTTDTTNAADDTTTAPVEETTADLYATGHDLGGFEFTILNVPLTLWNMNTDLDFEAQSRVTHQ